MIESLLPIIVFIDDYSALCTTKKETSAFVWFVKLIKRSRRINCIYLVAAAPLILSTLPDDFVSLFSATFTFKCGRAGDFFT